MSGAWAPTKGEAPASGTASASRAARHQQALDGGAGLQPARERHARSRRAAKVGGKDEGGKPEPRRAQFGAGTARRSARRRWRRR